MIQHVSPWAANRARRVTWATSSRLGNRWAHNNSTRFIVSSWDTDAHAAVLRCHFRTFTCFDGGDTEATATDGGDVDVVKEERAGQQVNAQLLPQWQEWISFCGWCKQSCCVRSDVSLASGLSVQCYDASPCHEEWFCFFHSKKKKKKKTCSYLISIEEVVPALTVIATRLSNNCEVPEATPSVSSVGSFAFFQPIGFKKKK